MAEVSGGAIRLIDRDGDPLDDGNGKLNINATLEAASVNIGDVDILTVPAPLNLTGGGTESNALRVTIANDSTGVITVDGAVNATLSPADNAALDLIGEAVHVEDSAHSTAHKGILPLGVRRDELVGTGAGTDGDYASLNIDGGGGLYVTENSAYTLDTFAMIDVDNSAESLADTIGVFSYIYEIFLQADESNTGYVMVGDGDVADNRGMKLNPGDTIILNINDTRQVILWGSASNQNVRCMIKLRLT